MLMDIKNDEIIENKFAKLFFSDIQRLYGLSGQELHLLFYLIKDCRYENKLNLTPKKKKVIAKDFNFKSHLSITNLIHKLINKDILKKEVEDDRFDYRYLINPHILFKGNDYQRAKIIIQYSKGEREVIVVKSKDAE